MNPLRFSFICVSALFLICSDLAAETIYRWVDPKGEVHFSDAPPEGRATDVQLLEVAKGLDAAPGRLSHYYSVTNQARRLEEQRLAREKALAEKRKLQAERRWLEEQQRVDPSRPVTAIPVYTYPAPYRRPFRPRAPGIEHYPAGDHPAYRPFRPPHRTPSLSAGKRHSLSLAR